jgi:tetratricopeptide (TPR) repeat protein
MSGFNHSYRGEYSRSCACFEQGLQNPACVMGVFHPRVGSLMSLARMLLYLGHLDHAQARYEEGIAEARKSNPFTLATALILGIMWFRSHGDFGPLADELLGLAEEQGFKALSAFARMARGWSLAMSGHTEKGIAQIIEGSKAQGQVSLLTYMSPPFLAEAYGAAGQPKEGLRQLISAEQTPQMCGFIGGWAEIYLVRGRLLLLSGDSVAAESALGRAIDVAREREAKFLELLAAMELARLWNAQGKREPARDLLGPVYGRFTEGFQMPVIKKAKALLEELA